MTGWHDVSFVKWLEGNSYQPLLHPPPPIYDQPLKLCQAIIVAWRQCGDVRMPSLVHRHVWITYALLLKLDGERLHVSFDVNPINAGQVLDSVLVGTELFAVHENL